MKKFVGVNTVAWICEECALGLDLKLSQIVTGVTMIGGKECPRCGQMKPFGYEVNDQSIVDKFTKERDRARAQNE